MVFIEQLIEDSKKTEAEEGGEQEGGVAQRLELMRPRNDLYPGRHPYVQSTWGDQPESSSTYPLLKGVKVSDIIRSVGASYTNKAHVPRAALQSLPGLRGAVATCRDGRGQQSASRIRH